MKRVLITGVTGYIGSRLARGLLPEYEVFGVAREPLRTDYIADIRDGLRLRFFDGGYQSMESILREVRPDLVYHLAAYYTGAHGARETPALIASNVVMGACLLEAMAACGSSRLVYASTVMEHYGGAEYRPLNLYAATKRAFSDLLAYYADIGAIHAVTLVLSDTYGPGDRRPKVLNLIADAVRRGEPIALSDGRQAYDAVYIDDVVRAFRMAGERLLEGAAANQAFQVASANPLSLRETVERMLQVNGLSLNALWGGRPAPEREIRQAVRVLPALPGWEPRVSLDDGLKRLWDGACGWEK